MHISKVATAIIGVGVVLTGFGLLSGTAGAEGNPIFYEGDNATTCAQVNLDDSDQYDGSTTTGVDVTSLFTATVTDDRYVTISAVAAGVTFQAVVVKGGNNYNVYNPPVANMQAPLNGGENVPALSHWFACYTYDPPETTPPTEAPTTAAPTTAAPTTAAPTTAAPTTQVAAAGPTTTSKVASEAPVTTAPRALPTTGNGQASGDLMLLGFLLIGLGSVVMVLSRTATDS